MLRGKLLLAVSAERVTVAYWSGRAIARHLTVAGGAEGIAACRAALSGYRDVPVYLLADAVEEDYRTEILPHARGGDRRELLARRLRQHYRNTPYCAAERLGREPGGRRDDRYQLAALTCPELLEPWIALLEELSLPLAAVHLLPMAGAALVRKLELAVPHAMLVASTSGGLRLTYFRGGQFRLSRLTRFDAAGGHGRAQFHVEEIANTRLYLHALQAAALDEPLAIVLLDPHDEDADAFRAIAAETPSLQCLHLCRTEVARLLKGCALSPGDPVELVFLHLLALRPPGYNLAPVAALAGHRDLRHRAALYRACAAVVAAAGAACAYAAWQVHDSEAQIARTVGERERYEAQYQAATRSFPAAPAPAAALQQAVAVARRLKSDARTPESAMRIVSRALASAPDIALNELAWKDGRQRSLAAPTLQPAVQAAEENATLAGEVRPFAGDYRAAVAAIRSFADALARDPAVREVRLVRLPLNVDPSVALAGNTRDTDEPAGSAEFTLHLVLKGRT